MGDGRIGRQMPAAVAERVGRHVDHAHQPGRRCAEKLDEPMLHGLPTAAMVRPFWDAAMWVVKLGGSLHDAPALRRWLRRLADAGGPPRIVVPGGGPFADAVRGLQPRLGIDDRAAHRMAILAMQQFGLALQSLEPRLRLAETDAELHAARAAVWLPWRLAGADKAIAASWEVTSD